ncbi:hypothetical protein [Methylobacterium sp. WL12]|nr:hypothetical protein [Methylobacterium sp. WL12]
MSDDTTALVLALATVNAQLPVERDASTKQRAIWNEADRSPYC